MLTASQTIAQYVTRGREAFDNDPAVRDAIVYQIAILGEAAKAVAAADETVDDEIDIDLSDIARMRDKVMHHYWAVDRQIVWDTATTDVPKLAAAIERLLASHQS